MEGGRSLVLRRPSGAGSSENPFAKAISGALFEPLTEPFRLRNVSETLRTSGQRAEPASAREAPASARAAQPDIRPAGITRIREMLKGTGGPITQTPALDPRDRLLDGVSESDAAALISIIKTSASSLCLHVGMLACFDEMYIVCNISTPLETPLKPGTHCMILLIVPTNQFHTA